MAIPLGCPLPDTSRDRPGRRRGNTAAGCPACRPYLVLLPVGFAVPLPLPVARWALTPPFHPYRAFPPERPAEGFPPAGHRGESHRRFIFCGAVRGRICAARLRSPRKFSPLALPGALPFSLRRLSPKTFVPGVVRGRLRCPDFPPGLPSCEGRPSDHPACPPLLIIQRRHETNVTS